MKYVNTLSGHADYKPNLIFIPFTTLTRRATFMYFLPEYRHFYELSYIFNCFKVEKDNSQMASNQNVVSITSRSQFTTLQLHCINLSISHLGPGCSRKHFVHFWHTSEKKLALSRATRVSGQTANKSPMKPPSCDWFSLLVR